ncbi:DUF6168 family protein [Psychroserpens sp. XS_ASV72]|uniref:DUF6168 family protein n=1 Tax=Psychroserpens sp. XS_ASV72 TaxID=3241293 RepID=UPI00351570F5
MNSAIFKFCIKISLILAVTFGVHLLLLNQFEKPLFDNKIVLSYIVNALMAIFIFMALYKLKDQFKEQLGFLFLAGSVLKFVLFFILFYGTYKADGTISKLEFAAFFVPYILCLVIETYSLSKWLNKLQ